MTPAPTRESQTFVQRRLPKDGGKNSLNVKAGFFLGYLERDRDLERERERDRDLEREDLEDLELERDVDRPLLRDRLHEGFARVLPKNIT